MPRSSPAFPRPQRRSAKGVAAVEGFLPAISDLLNRQLGTLDGGEQRQLEKLLKKMLAGLDG